MTNAGLYAVGGIAFLVVAPMAEATAPTVYLAALGGWFIRCAVAELADGWAP